MKVELIDYTGKGARDEARHAANVLVFTKQTRLNMTPDLMKEIENWSWSKIEEELEYMANTIPSSWEFINYSFLITGVTRGFTHQFVRTRTGSYAQQTMRVLDVGGWTYGTGPTIPDGDALMYHEQMNSLDGSCYLRKSEEEAARLYHSTMGQISDAYDGLVKSGIAIEDARGILPTNIHTNICASFSLRTITDLVRKRSSSRTQGEYRDVLEGLKSEVIKAHPWAEIFINRNFDDAAARLEKEIEELYCGRKEFTHEEKISLVKLIDQMRKG